MTTEVEKIVKVAQRYKACAKVLEIDSMENAIRTLFTSQGREFAVNTKYPTIEVFRENKAFQNVIEGLYIDRGKEVSDKHDIVAVGDTDMTVHCHGVEALYHIIAMHGAKVKIIARRYAVVTVTDVCADVEIDNDGTAVVNIER